MKRKLSLLLFCAVLVSNTVQAAEAPAVASPPESANLDAQLQALGTAGNEAPAGVTGEKLYAVQNRYVPLRFRHEVSVGAGSNFTADSFLISRSLDAAYRFFLSNRWYLGLAGNYVFNEYTPGGQKLVENPSVALAPDVGVVKYRTDFQVGYNLFYGKFRLTMDKVFYFDQYIALGPGYVVLNTTRRWAAVGDVGFAFWFGRNLSFRVGFKDYFFNEQRTLTSGLAHNISGYLQAGYVFGG